MVEGPQNLWLLEKLVQKQFLNEMQKRNDAKEEMTTALLANTFTVSSFSFSQNKEEKGKKMANSFKFKECHTSFYSIKGGLHLGPLYF